MVNMKMCLTLSAAAVVHAEPCSSGECRLKIGKTRPERRL